MNESEIFMRHLWPLVYIHVASQTRKSLPFWVRFGGGCPLVCNQNYALFSPLIISKFSTKVCLARKYPILSDVRLILEKSDNQRLTISDVFPRCKRRLFVLQKTAFWSAKD